jgi:hypothetical protein
MAMTSSSAQSTNVVEVRRTVSAEEAIMLATAVYVAGRIDVVEFERRVAAALGVR